MTLAVAFSPTVNLGAVLLAALLALGGILKFFYGAQWKTQAELAEKNYGLADARANQLDKWLEEALAREKRISDRLTKTMDELVKAKDEIALQAAEVERMKALPNLAQVLDSFRDGFQRTDADAAERTASAVRSLEEFVGKQLAGHEERAQERQAGILRVLERIAAKLGPDAERAAGATT